MRNSIEITRKYQFAYMLLRHIIALLVCALFECCIFFWALNMNIMRYVASGIFVLVYGGMLYSNARKLALLDGKPYTPLKPEPKWSWLWGIMISATMLAAIGICYANKAWLISDSSTTTLVSIALNVIVFIWTVPYYGFLTASGTLMPSVPVAAVMLIVPMLACVIGYRAGMKKFDILEKLDALTFEKEEDEE